MFQDLMWYEDLTHPSGMVPGPSLPHHGLFCSFMHFLSFQLGTTMPCRLEGDPGGIPDSFKGRNVTFDHFSHF